MRVAVVGCGIAGATSAFLLAEHGHDVTLFEQASQCGPVGAGILLQPAGQDVLAELGLLDQVVKQASRIDALHAQHRSGRTLVHLEYGRLAAGLHGLGVHRGDLFELLFERCLAADVNVRESVAVDSYTQDSNKVVLQTTDNQPLGEFDLVVAADGSRSTLRSHAGHRCRRVEYPYAALWLTGPWSGDDTRLLQVVDRDGRLIGILPIGAGRASFFWGIWKHERDSMRAGGVNAWKASVQRFHPEAGEIADPIASMDDVTFATYRNVLMKSPVSGRVVFIGDAAHAMSPHLGQGTNLALADALCLSHELSHDRDPQSSLLAFANQRRSLIAYYSRLTAFLTPFFQTDRRVLQFGRDLTLPIMPKLPWVGREMLRTLAGQKPGWLR